MTCVAFTALILFWSGFYRVPAGVVDSQIFRESSCNPEAVHKRTGAVGLGQILPGGSASLGFSPGELRRPNLNVALTARHLRRCYDICRTWKGARRVYGGHRFCSAK